MKKSQQSRSYSYLALGDSYTIGEMVKPEESFPLQVVQKLKTEGIILQKPRIIAKTGWTTDELADAIEKDQPHANYDFVTLLIGVNNQYRGWPLTEYRAQFESLLKQAIHFAKDNRSKVVVLSIPDWGVTPYAAGRNKQEIATQINAFNSTNLEITQQYHVKYIDITAGTRLAASDPTLLATDGLHPSGKEYAKWSDAIVIYFKSIFSI